MILNLPPETETIIIQNAQNSGLSPTDYVLSLIDMKALTSQFDGVAIMQSALDDFEDDFVIEREQSEQVRDEILA